MYKQASKQKLRVSTSKGNLSVEQLWDLSLSDLDELAVSLEKAYNESSNKSFLVKKTAKNKNVKLMFDIVLDILTTKVEENEVLTQSRENKEHNQKILDLIASKKDEELKSKSVKDLEKLLK